jgi:hypothetical protein
MPVGFVIENEQLIVRQSFDFPAVYLDHWAIRHFSTEKEDGQRFINALKVAGGAFIISHTNLAEITGPSDPRHAEEIATFLEAILPNIFFAQFNIELAMKQEVGARVIGFRLMAPPNIELLQEVARQRPNDFRPFTISGVIKIIAEHRERLGITWRNLNRSIANRINAMRCDANFIETARTFSGHPQNIPTLAVFQELLRPIFLDQRLRIDLNDAADIQHATMAIAYCDFVLLDGKWKDMHSRMKRRFVELGLKIPTARVFSARSKGVAEFLSVLEGTNSNNFDNGSETRE